MGEIGDRRETSGPVAVEKKVSDPSKPASSRPPVLHGVPDPRMLAAWHEWLTALASDAEAAIAAAHVYSELSPEAREAWLDALAEDAPKLKVPVVAVYAPLLSVEADETRRQRIEQAVGGEITPPSARGNSRAYRGIGVRGEHYVAITCPLYLRFVQVLYCKFSPYEGFDWVRHNPIVLEEDSPHDGALIEGIRIESTPLKIVIEELAHAVLAQSRKRLELPTELQLFADLFDAILEPESLG